MIQPNIPLITILGPTASGKTALALALAKHFDGEIICADSRTIYRGMDIGTAKPSVTERIDVPHHLLDIIAPDQTLSAAEFKIRAEESVRDIAARGKIPFLVGGSGLYIDAVIYDYSFPKAADPVMRAELERLSDHQLLSRWQALRSEADAEIDVSNRRRVMRAIETVGQVRNRRPTQLPNVLTLGLSMNKEVAQQRIRSRIDLMLKQGFIDEVRRIGEQYGWESEAMSSIGYRAFRGVVSGQVTIDESTELFVRGDMALMKKQLTWFKRNKSIRWLDDPQQAQAIVAAFLASARI